MYGWGLGRARWIDGRGEGGFCLREKKNWKYKGIILKKDIEDIDVVLKIRREKWESSVGRYVKGFNVDVVTEICASLFFIEFR